MIELAGLIKNTTLIIRSAGERTLGLCKKLNLEHDGYPMARIPYLAGLQDYEQYNRDIFRKCFVQAHKHLSRAELFVAVCKNGMQTDKDYSAGLAGFVAGL